MGNSATFTSPAVTGLSAGVGIRQNVFNEIDEIGLLLGEPRLVGERNPAYKQRLLKVFAERANSTYRGLIHGATRGLGFSLYDAVTISFLESGGAFIAPNPAAIFSEAYLYLYSNIQTKTLDRKIDRYNKLGTAYTLQDLVARINESTYFSAIVAATADPYSRSMCILNQKSHLKVSSEVIVPAFRFALTNTNIVKGTLFFSDRAVFAAEVLSEGAVTSAGKYHIDYKKGQVVVFSQPVLGTIARYEYLKSPMVCKASPVIIHNLQHQDFKDKMFEQVLADDGTFVNGLATPVGADLINELITVFPGYWGE